MSSSLRPPSRFFTPPQLRKLNIDLARLDGEGEGPAQFYGETHDGRKFYGRYRGGWLSIYIATVNPVEMSNEHKVLSVQLGPPLDGGMTLGQLCHYAGLTINGTLPPLPTANEMLEARATDLGGNLSFYDCWVSSSRATARNLLRRMVKELGDSHLLEMDFKEGFERGYWVERLSVDDVEADFFSVVLSKEWDSEALAKFRGSGGIQALFPNALQISIRALGIVRRRFQVQNGVVEWLKKNHSLDIKVASLCDFMLSDWLSLSACYRTDDLDALSRLRSVDALVDESYPLARHENYDIVTGEKLPSTGWPQPTDPEIVTWAAADRRHWCSAWLEGKWDNHRAIGVVPEFLNRRD